METDNNQPTDDKNEINEEARIEIEPIDRIEPSVEVVSLPKKRFRLTKKELAALILIVVAFIIGAGGMYALTGRKNNDSLTSSQSETYKTKTKTTSAENEETTQPVTEKINWLSTPIEVADLPIFEDIKQYYGSSFSSDTDLDTYVKENTKYYQVGSINGSQDKLYVVKYINYIVDVKLLIRSSNNTFVIYKQHSLDAFYDSNEDGDEEYHGPSLKSTVTINENSQISEIVAPETLTYNNQPLAQAEYRFSNSQFVTTNIPESNSYVTYIKLGDLNNGVLYQAVIKDEPSFKAVYYSFLLKDHRLYTYSYGDKILTGGIPDITWSNGSTNSAAYRSAVIGCGSGKSIGIAKNISDSDLEIIGKASDDKPIYGFKNNDNQLLQKEYEEYKSYHTYDKDYISIEDFKKQQGVYLAKDSFGQYILLIKEDFFPVGGCAKPVVYLYPNAPTFVNVSVNADVTLSDPYYPKFGWRNILALPNGRLIYNSQGYDSLFWEGYGHGFYPEVETGSIVKRAEAENKIKSDLKLLGLNSKEISDFMEFWMPEIPNTPYIRISWLDTEQMENLAKLNVFPKPDTLIRVFLDMQGLQEPTSIKAQTLTAVERTGFTVVEWGGLARDSSVPKLQ